MFGHKNKKCRVGDSRSRYMVDKNSLRQVYKVIIHFVCIFCRFDLS